MRQSSNAVVCIESSETVKWRASKEEQRGIVCFLSVEVGGTDIHRRMSQVYGEHCMSFARVKAWHKRFREGRVSLADDARSGTPHCITDHIVQLVDGLIIQDRRVKVKTVPAKVRLNVGCVHIIMMERLNWHKVCTQWVPHSLQPQQEACRMAHCSAVPGKGMSSWHEWWLEMSLGVISSNQEHRHFQTTI